MDPSKFAISINLEKAIKEYQAAAQRESGSIFRTSTGVEVNMLKFSAKDVSLEDIAHGLSNICRYSGQCKTFYSVAEHSVHVSKFVEDLYSAATPGLIKAAFLHDAAESYIGDVTTPLKQLCPGYKIIEHKFETAIIDRFKIPIGFSHPVIRHCDTGMYHIEAQVLMPDRDRPNSGSFDRMFDYQDKLPRISCFPPEQAKKFFLDRASELGIR